MTLSPYPHQKTGAEWLAARERAGLFDEQGLGKTITAILAAKRVGARRVTVLAPTVVAWNWLREVRAWAGRSAHVVSAGATSVPDEGWVIVTHGMMPRPRVRAALLAQRPSVLIVDESHYFRTPSAQRTRALWGRWENPDAPSIASTARRVWCLTGTPMPNDASELWSTVWGLAPERILTAQGRPLSHAGFRSAFCHTRLTKYGPKVVGNRNLDVLKRRIEGLFLRRRKSDHLDLPPIRWELVTLAPTHRPDELSELDRELSRDIRAACEAAGDPVAAFKTLGQSTKLARYRRLCGLAKADAVAALLRGELEFGALRKVVVFAVHLDVLEALRDTLEPFGVRVISGATPAVKRSEHVRAFQENPRVRVMLCQLQAGGVGITLTAAFEAVFAELSWVPGDNAQAADRIHRIGQTSESVRVRFVALAETADELVANVLRRKTKMIREVLS